MKTIFLVTPDQMDIVIKIKHKLLTTPKSSGIVFVGVKIQPACELQPKAIYHVAIGYDNDLDSITISKAVAMLLKDTVDESSLQIEAFRGSIR